jgi:L-alanine-DL-glutamate epimerase-like enolase superfamily enzyme
VSRVTAVSTQVATTELENPIVIRGEGFRFYDNVVVHVDTDDGVRGSSYVWFGSGRHQREPEPNSAASLLESVVAHVAPAVVGENVFAYNRVWDAVHRRHGQLGAGGLVSLAHSGIDMAIWDAIGKLTGQPIHRLLGAARESVPVYSSEMMEVWDGTTEDWVAKALQLVGRGIKAMKMLIGLFAPEVDLERVAAVRAAVGPEIGLLVDAASGWGYGEALHRCRQLEELGLVWIEDPMPLDDADKLARLCAEIDTPIATGERSFSVHQLRTLVERGSLDVLIFDPMRIGGVTGAARIAGLTQAFGIPLAIHAYSDLGANLIGAFPNGMMMEYLPWWGPLMKSPFSPEDGYGRPSTRPGLGMEFDLASLERLRTYPRLA